MTLQQCRYLTEIARHTSLSQAAEALFLTQPSLSRAIHALEEELGIRILARSSRGVLFTQEGEELLFYARILLEQEAAAREHFQKPHNAAKLSVSSQHFSFCADAFARFAARMGDAPSEWTLREGRTQEVVHDVYAGRSQVGIVSVSARSEAMLARDFAAKSLSFTPLLRRRMHAFLRKGHPLAGRDALTPDDLAPYPRLTYQQGDIPLYFAESADLAPAARTLYLEDRASMHALLCRTDGYNLGSGLLPTGFTPAELCAVPLAEGPEMQIGLLLRRDRVPSPEAAAFLDALYEVVRELEG